MTPSQLKPPSLTTLKKYGLTIESWYAMGDLQEWTCPVCGLPFTQERGPVVDHLHVRNFKKMKPEQKVRYFRGLLHAYCNLRLIPKGMTTEKAYNIYVYLNDFDVRLGE